jgi:hypothetical protein
VPDARRNVGRRLSAQHRVPIDARCGSQRQCSRGPLPPSHLGFTDSRMLNALAQPDLEAAGYYAQKELQGR